MRPIRIPSLTPLQHTALDQLYRTTKEPRWRTRAQMVLPSVEQGLKGPQIAAIVRQSEATVLRWLKRSLAEGLEGGQDAPRPGRPAEITAAYRAKLLAVVRRRPRRWQWPFSLWTRQRLADYLAEHTGLRASDETVRRALQQAGIGLSRPQHKSSRPDPEYALNKRRLKPPVTLCTPVTCFTLRTQSRSVGCPLCAPWGARGASPSCFLPQDNRTSARAWAPSTTRRAKPWGSSDAGSVARRSPHGGRRWLTRIPRAPSL